ncbi:CXXC motif containing zinc binding protein-like [Pteropus medius]|uniref:CXXC motif containing zinc binding protein-like n=1 Tax=Pteropus vampyrus TaxID=132908 RepID=UPI00196A8AEC|nr:CXXC motif containing zinc binding protein-like [Pteropus giganteus]
MLENITNLQPMREGFRWCLKMKCGSCGRSWQCLHVQKCKLCTKENSIKIPSSTIKDYNAKDNEKFKMIVDFECQSPEPVDFLPQAGIAAECMELGTIFSDINLQGKD